MKKDYKDIKRPYKKATNSLINIKKQPFPHTNQLRTSISAYRPSMQSQIKHLLGNRKKVARQLRNFARSKNGKSSAKVYKD